MYSSFSNIILFFCTDFVKMCVIFFRMDQTFVVHSNIVLVF